MSNTVNTESQAHQFAVSFHQSLTGALNERAAHALTVTEENGTIVAAAKKGALAVTSAVLAVVGIVETVARHAIALVAKLLTVLVPKQWAEGIDSKVIRPLVEHAGVTTAATAQAATQIVTSFLSTETRESVHGTIDRGTAKVYNSNVVDSLTHLHINGFTGGYKAPAVEIKEDERKALDALASEPAESRAKAEERRDRQAAIRSTGPRSIDLAKADLAGSSRFMAGVSAVVRAAAHMVKAREDSRVA